MHATASKVVADLIGLLPGRERDLLRRLAEAGGKGTVPVASRSERVAAAGLASRLPSAVHYEASRRELRLVCADAAGLLREATGGCTDCAPMDPVARIRAAQDSGQFERAVSLFRENGGVYFIHFHGNAACLDVLNRFPKEVMDAEEVLTLALSMHALKAGNITRARFLMTQRYGDDMLSLEAVIRRPDRYSLGVREFRFLMAIYEDHPVSNELRALLFDMLAEFPIDDHLHRGGFYNSMLSVCLQRQELDEAEEIAKRAHHHYREAGAHLLVIVVTSDHGDYLGDHWLGEKELFHDQSMRVPMIVRDPRASADATRGTVSAAFVEAIDLLPTFLDALGIETARHRLEGRSLCPLLRGPTPRDWRDHAFSEIDYSFYQAGEALGVDLSAARAYAIRTERWKYVHFKGFRPQLFDLADDPQEFRDLGESRAHAAVLDEMRTRLLERLTERRNRTSLADDAIPAMRPHHATRGIRIGEW